MAEPKHKRRNAREPEPEDEEGSDLQPLEAGLRGPGDDDARSGPSREEDLPPDEYLLLKVVEANGEHLRTMRIGLGLGMLVLLVYVAFGSLFQASLGPVGAGLVVFLVAGALLGAGLHALARQLELLRRSVAATDHFVFGPADDHDHP